MLFNSYQFLVFFIVVTILFFLLPHRYRWLHLLVASCVFYMAFVPVYIFILFATIIIDYIAGIIIENASDRNRKTFLVVSIVTNVLVLCVFKYYNFFVENFNALFELTSLHVSLSFLSILLPIGLSFHTFQAMSYTIEVYRGNQKAERHFGIYALYVMFYPQLVAGPIERPQNVLHQFHERQFFSYSNVTNGLKLMAWGLFKKVVIADRLAKVTDHVYSNLSNQSSLAIIIALIFFSFEIFCDFSGYSDMAIGAAKVMGFDLMRNFNRPYFSRSISEFWKRWHISLSTWFRDYLYISLGGNRVGVERLYFNLFLVFLVSGFWHGANWTFILWGALHGFYLIFALATQSLRHGIIDKLGFNRQSKGSRFLSVAITFVLVTFAWIFFRSPSLSVAYFIIKKLILTALRVAGGDIYSTTGYHLDEDLLFDTGIGFASIFFLEFVHYLKKDGGILAYVNSKPKISRWIMYYFIASMILLFGVFQQRTFIYFQF